MYESSAPARLCLYGEHQDYLGLNVIPCAIDLRLFIQASEKQFVNNLITVKSLEFQKSVSIPVNIKKPSSTKNSFKTYLEAGMLAIKQHLDLDIIPSFDAIIKSEVPIESGLSSSAALLVAWINLLKKIVGIPLTRKEIAEMAYVAEHDIMGIPCGRMDQYATAIGGVIKLNPTDQVEYTKLKSIPAKLVVVNSNIPKLTSSVHGKIVSQVKEAVDAFEKLFGKSILKSEINDLKESKKEFSPELFSKIKAIISIKEATEKAEVELKRDTPNLTLLGELLTSQQKHLRDGIKVSLPILDKIVEQGESNGAYGGKLTGAGLGGCVVLLCPDDIESILNAIEEKLGLPYWVVQVDNEGVL